MKYYIPTDLDFLLKGAFKELSIKEEKIPGGLASGKKPKDFNSKKLKEGAKVESEHTKDKDTQKEIAMDHLTEDKNYYKKLKTIEKKRG